MSSATWHKIQTTNRRWKDSAPHKTSTVVAMHGTLERFVPVDLFVRTRQCVFAGCLSFVVRIWMCAAEHSWSDVSLHKHIAMITPVRDGIALQSYPKRPHPKSKKKVRSTSEIGSQIQTHFWSPFGFRHNHVAKESRPKKWNPFGVLGIPFLYYRS